MNSSAGEKKGIVCSVIKLAADFYSFYLLLLLVFSFPPE